MSAEQQIDVMVQKAKLKIAERMLRAAQFVQREHMERLNVPNTGVRMKRVRDTRQVVGMSIVTGGKKGSSYTAYPNSSKPGEYPRKRTGEGQRGVVYGPTTPEEIVAAGMVVRLGQTMPSAHMVHLEFGRYQALGVWIKFNRLGWVKTARDCFARVRALITGKG